MTSAAALQRAPNQAPLGVPTQLLLPGEHASSWAPKQLTTLLGSCVAACLWDTRLHIGAMNHFMLPDVPDSDSVGLPTRYGLYAMERIVNDLIMMGSDRKHMVAKVFGGASMSGFLESNSIGRRNAAFVLKFLEADRIKVVAQDLGGEHSRRVQFNTSTGAVRLQKMTGAQASSVVQEEKTYLNSLKKSPPAGEIVFF